MRVVQIMRQERVQKSRKSLALSARQYTYAEQDAQTERVIEDALKASKRARKLLRELKAV